MNGAQFYKEYGTALQLAIDAETVPMRVVDPNGDILEIKSVNFSFINGGVIHIVTEEVNE